MATAAEPARPIAMLPVVRDAGFAEHKGTKSAKRASARTSLARRSTQRRPRSRHKTAPTGPTWHTLTVLQPNLSFRTISRPRLSGGLAPGEVTSRRGVTGLHCSPESGSGATEPQDSSAVGRVSTLTRNCHAVGTRWLAPGAHQLPLSRLGIHPPPRFKRNFSDRDRGDWPAGPRQTSMFY